VVPDETAAVEISEELLLGAVVTAALEDSTVELEAAPVVSVAELDE
jgi:hypothetical protein